MVARSPGLPRVVWLDGQVIPAAAAKLSVFDRAVAFAESVYEVCPVVGASFPWLADHVERMRRGAAMAGLTDVPALETWSALGTALIGAEPDFPGEGLLYAQLTGGSGPREHSPADAPRATFFAYLTPFRFPRVDDAHSYRLHVAMDTRWRRCDVKTTMLLPAVLAKKQAAARGADEALMVQPDGTVGEGASSNFFGILDAVVRTAPVGSHVLPGIARGKLIEAARQLGIAVEETAMRVDEIPRLEGAFITSTGRLLTPVREIDDVPIPVGGEIAMQLARRIETMMGLSANE